MTLVVYDTFQAYAVLPRYIKA